MFFQQVDKLIVEMKVVALLRTLKCGVYIQSRPEGDGKIRNISGTRDSR
jgi:hypothetical protein